MRKHPFEQSVSIPPANTLRIKPTPAWVLAWVSIAFFTFCAVMSWRSGQTGASPFFLIWVAFGIFLLCITGSVEMNSETIAYITPSGRYQIKWDEVVRIELGTKGSGIVFYGENKRLYIIGDGYWSGPERDQMRGFFRYQINKRNIPVQQTWAADYKLSKNTRISR